MVLALLISLLAAPPAAEVPEQLPDQVAGMEQFSTMQMLSRPTHRLRKLHLVRPDLIPYPLAITVYC